MCLPLQFALAGLLLAQDASAREEVSSPADVQALKAIQGLWIVASFQMHPKPAGSAAADEQRKGVRGRVVIDDSDYQLFIGDSDSPIEKGTFKIDADKTPHTIDFLQESPKKGVVHLGIFQIKDGALRINTGHKDRARPSDFEAKNSTLVKGRKAETKADQR